MFKATLITAKFVQLNDAIGRTSSSCIENNLYLVGQDTCGNA